MGAATVERFLPATEYGPRVAPVSCVVLHHAATTSLVALERLMGPGGRTVSAHFAVKDHERVAKVPLKFRALSLGSALWDSRAVTVECANESTDGWTISAASHESLAIIVAEAAREFGFWPHRDGTPKSWTVLGHREVFTIHGASYETACPGGMNLDAITRRAQDILRGVKLASSIATELTAQREKEDPTMSKAIQIHYPKPDGSGYLRALVIPGTGYFFPWDAGHDATLANEFGNRLETGNSIEVTQSVFEHMQALADRMRPVPPTNVATS